MRRTGLVIPILLAAASCPAALVSQRWGGPASPCTHADALTVIKGKTGPRLW